VAVKISILNEFFIFNFLSSTTVSTLMKIWNASWAANQNIKIIFKDSCHTRLEQWSFVITGI